MTEKHHGQVEANVATEDKLFKFWVNNSKKIILVLGVIVLAGGALYAYNALVKAPKEIKASEALFRSESYYRQDSIQLALNGDKMNPGFLEVIKKYGGTKAANLAEFYAGSCYLKLGEFENAIRHFKAFSTDSRQVQARSISLLGDAYSELGKNEEAAAAYKKAGTLFAEDDFNSPEYLFRAGYLYESLGKNKEAIEMYKLIKEKYPRSERGYSVDKYLARLGEISE
jgi:tetratricopeptide (TPR) repeat protein